MEKKRLYITKEIEYPKNGIISKEILDTPGIGVTLFCMSKGSGLSEHTSTREGFVYVLEGKGVFNLKGKEIMMAPAVFIHLPKNAVHSLKAEQNTSFLLSLSGKRS